MAQIWPAIGPGMPGVPPRGARGWPGTLQGMVRADQPVPPAGSPSSGASFAGSDEPAPSRNPFGRLAHGRWLVFVLYVLALLLWVALAANAVYQHQWVNFAGYTCIAVLFLVVPTGAMRRLSHMLMSRKAPSPPSSSS